MRKNSNYVCSICGRGFTRGWNGGRHIKNVESGAGKLLTAAEYRSKVSSGDIEAQFPKRRRAPQPSKKDKTSSVDLEEFTRGYYRRMGELKCEEQYKDEKEGKHVRKMIDLLYNMMSRREIVSGLSLRKLDSRTGAKGFIENSNVMLPKDPEKQKKFLEFTEKLRKKRRLA